MLKLGSVCQVCKSLSFTTLSSAEKYSSSPTLCPSKNVNNSESEVVLHELEVAAMADVILQG